MMIVVAVWMSTVPRAVAEETNPAQVRSSQPSGYDLSQDRVLYVVGYAHLDSQWRWTYQDTIRKFIPNTMHDNFRLMEKYPDYVFNFTGARRYMLMKEYYPEDYKRVKDLIAQGRWHVCGSSVDECDVNVPSPESIIRHVLYGNRFFRQEFGLDSVDFMLPDCFGFPASLPSILVHCGVKGFSTQKLSWGSAVGVPFNVGVWEGPDGRSVVAALNPGSYTGRIRSDLSHDANWLKRIEDLGKQSGAYADYHYYGVGDVGGAPDEESVQWLEKSVAGDGPITVVAAAADQLFKDLSPEQIARLPRYKGDLLLTEHSAGSLTSQAYMKRWNRKNELLADAAERVSAVADWLGGAAYPRDKLTAAWLLVLGSQMHDILPGTSLPKAYEFSWNDEVVASNQFAAILEDAAGTIATALDTRVEGVPVIVFNPLSIEREDIVEARVHFPDKPPKAVRVFGPNGQEVPSQETGRDGTTIAIVFLARVPSVGFAVYEVRSASLPCTLSTGLRVETAGLENDRYVARLDENGDVASLWDKAGGRELLSGPARLAFVTDAPQHWPAWNMDWEDHLRPPRAYVQGPAEVRVVESGPARVALEVRRRAEGSQFVQRIRLAAAAAGDRIEFDTWIDWRTRASCLKASFPLAVSNTQATYNLGLGTVERATNNPRKYEVPSHQWLDLTDSDGSYGIALLEDCKYGSDKPNDHTLRLTLLRTPACTGYFDQGTQDLGRHRMLYALAGHRGDWRLGDVSWVAARMNQPLMAFQTPTQRGSTPPYPAHPFDSALGRLGEKNNFSSPTVGERNNIPPPSLGKIPRGWPNRSEDRPGRSFSFLQVSTPQVAVRAIKKAEASDELVIRLQELHGRSAKNVRVSMTAPILSAREVDGQEQPSGEATVHNGSLCLDLEAYGLRAFALKPAPPAKPAEPPQCCPLMLPFDVDVVSSDGESAGGRFDDESHSLPSELLPSTLTSEGVLFKLGSTKEGEKNALTCRGQKIQLPPGNYSRLYLLAATAAGDTTGIFELDGKPVSLTFQSWTGYVGQWDTRIWMNKSDISGLRPAFVKRDPIAWLGTHRHDAKGQNEPYTYCYLFKYGIHLLRQSRVLTLPKNNAIHILAMTAAANPHDDPTPAQQLYDAFEYEPLPPCIEPVGGRYSDSILVQIHPPWYRISDTLRYTTDGSEPTLDSPVFHRPFWLFESAAVKALSFNQNGRPALGTTAVFEVDDRTPPAIQAITAFALSPIVQIIFSEPLERSSAETASNYRIEPAGRVLAARASEDGMSVVLNLSHRLASNKEYRLLVSNLRDCSPAQNEVPAESSRLFEVVKPVLHLDFDSGRGAPAQQTSPLRSAAVLQGNATWVKGKVKRALYLSGSKAYVALADRPELNPTAAITVTAWFKAEDWDGNRRILQKGIEDNQYRLLGEDGEFLFSLAGIGEVKTSLPPLNRWHHVAGTYDGKVLRLFLDGAPVAEQTASGEILRTKDPLYIGTKKPNTAAGDFFRGALDEVTIWNCALPAEMVQGLARTN